MICRKVEKSFIYWVYIIFTLYLLIYKTYGSYTKGYLQLNFFPCHFVINYEIMLEIIRIRFKECFLKALDSRIHPCSVWQYQRMWKKMKRNVLLWLCNERNDWNEYILKIGMRWPFLFEMPECQVILELPIAFCLSM